MVHTGFGQALYYPYIHLENEKWLKVAALYYDNISRIVPDRFETNDSLFVKHLNEELDFIKQISPKREAFSCAHDFLIYAKNNLVDKTKRDSIKSQILKTLPSDSTFRIHVDKMAMFLRRELPMLGLAELQTDCGDGSWYEFEPVTGALYMTHLANKIAERRGLSIVSDDPIYQQLSRDSQLDFVDSVPDHGYTLASLVFDMIIPDKIESIPLKTIIAYRKKYNDERHQFYNGVMNLTKDIPKIEDPKSLLDCLQYHKRSIDIAVKNLKFSLKSIGISCATGFFGISLPSWISNISSSFSGYAPQIVTAGTLCVATGILAKEGVGYYKSKKNSPWSFLLSLEREVKKEKLVSALLNGTVMI